MITNTVNLPSRDEFSPSPRPSSSSSVKNNCACEKDFPSQTIKIFGVTIAVSNKEEKEHNLEINQNDCTGTNLFVSNHKRKATEFTAYFSSENNTTNIVASSSRVQEFNSDQTSLDLELRLGSPSIIRRRITGPQDPIIMGVPIVPYYTTNIVASSSRVQEFNPDQTSLDLELRLGSPSIIRRRITGPQDPIIMGGEIVPYVQPHNQIIMEAEIIQQVRAQAEDLDHWRIKKVLKKSDVDGSSRLLIGRRQVLTHITPFFTNNPSEFCQDKAGIRITIFDVDTLTAAHVDN
ncbi:Uncharacterized protein Adt_07501 [Abeliophyllum distichum]|uniref:Uncharacterized protein n=1 Tax=Abeliophyllum distichum TaxID=126358 RepID=A0ABD1V9X7_9LAMI